jgi:plastocyanin
MNEPQEPSKKVFFLLFAGLIVVSGAFFLLSKQQGQVLSMFTKVTPTIAWPKAQGEDMSGEHKEYEEPESEGGLNIIDIEQTGEFDPQTITVAKGSIIAFHNEDTNNHTIVPGNDNDVFQTVTLKPTEQVSVAAVEKEGTYTYFDKEHPEITGTIVVTGSEEDEATDEPTTE